MARMWLSIVVSSLWLSLCYSYDTEIICDYTYECYHSNLTCPKSHDCLFECTNDYSCAGTGTDGAYTPSILNASYGQSLQLDSYGSRSAEYVYLYSPNNYLNGINTNLNQESSFIAYCSGSSYACRASNWYITGTDYVDVRCMSVWTCHVLSLYVTDVTSFKWTCSSNMGCRYTKLNGNDVTYVEIDIDTDDGGWGITVDLVDVCYTQILFEESSSDCAGSYNFENVDIINGDDTLWDCLCSTSTTTIDSSLITINNRTITMDDINEASCATLTVNNYNPYNISNNTNDIELFIYSRLNECTKNKFYNSTSSTSSPSRYPSMYPSRNPSNYPSNYPSIDPSSYPSTYPSSDPSSDPSSFPTATPADTTTMSTKMTSTKSITTSTISTTTSESTKNESNSTNSNINKEILNLMLIIISLCVGCLILICCIYCLHVYKHKKTTGQTSEKEMEQVSRFENKNVHKDTHMDVSSKVNLNRVTSNTGTPRHKSNDILDGLFDDLDINDDNNPDPNIKDIQIEGDIFDDHHDEMYKPAPAAGESFATNKGSDMDVGSGETDHDSDGYEDELKLAVPEGDNHTTVTSTPDGDKLGLNENNYQEWSQKQVLVWIKLLLVKNGIVHEMIKSFLTEFSTKCITGSVLKTFKQQPKLIDALKSQFTQNNQAFGIWIIIQSSITSLGDEQ